MEWEPDDFDDNATANARDNIAKALSALSCPAK
jgi:hypothetical protein